MEKVNTISKDPKYKSLDTAIHVDIHVIETAIL